MSHLTGLPGRIGELAGSTSALAVHRECPTKYDLSFLHQLASENFHAPFFIGSMVHEGLEMFYRGVHPRKILQVINDKIVVKMAAAFIPIDEFDQAQKDANIVQGMLLGYFAHYGPQELKDWKIHDCEVGFSMNWDKKPGAKQIPMKGVIDMIGTYKDGRLWVVEHKTTGESGLGFLTKWRVGFQPHTYYWAAVNMWKNGLLPSEPAGVVINVIKKPGIRRKQTETQDMFNTRLQQEYLSNPDKYFAREWIPMDASNLAWYEKTQGHWVDRLRADAESQLFPMNTDSCHGRYGDCVFFPICSSGGRDPSIYQYYRVKENSFEEVKHVDVTDESGTLVRVPRPEPVASTDGIAPAGGLPEVTIPGIG